MNTTVPDNARQPGPFVVRTDQSIDLFRCYVTAIANARFGQAADFRRALIAEGFEVFWWPRHDPQGGGS